MGYDYEAVDELVDQMSNKKSKKKDDGIVYMYNTYKFWKDIAWLYMQKYGDEIALEYARNKRLKKEGT